MGNSPSVGGSSTEIPAFRITKSSNLLFSENTDTLTGSGTVEFVQPIVGPFDEVGMELHFGLFEEGSSVRFFLTRPDNSPFAIEFKRLGSTLLVFLHASDMIINASQFFVEVDPVLSDPIRLRLSLGLLQRPVRVQILPAVDNGTAFAGFDSEIDTPLPSPQFDMPFRSSYSYGLELKQATVRRLQLQ